MRVMVLVKATRQSEAGELPDPAMFEAMGKYNEALIEAGILLAADGLKPSSQGVRVRFSGSDRSVAEGPFPETEQLVAGYWLWQVSSMEEAIEWVRRCPNPMPGDSDIDIRPLYELADFA
ncbi:YciI family protein [soil metagenome]